MSEDSQDELSSDLSEKKFVDLNSLSAGARKAAALDIYNVFRAGAGFYLLSRS